MSGVHWVTKPTDYLEPKIDKTGYGSIPAITIIQQFQNCVERFPTIKALASKRAVDVNNAINKIC